VRMIVEKHVGKCSAFRMGSAARSCVTTRRILRADRSEKPASIPARASGREQPSGPGSGSTPCPNRGVAHAPSDSVDCERRAAAGTKRRPQKRCSRSPQVAWRQRDPTECTSSCRATVGPWIAGRAGSSFGANHRALSRPPSRRQPLRFEGWDHCEGSVEKSIKFYARIAGRVHRVLQRTDGAATGRQHPLSGGVSDHIAGRRLGRPCGQFGCSRHGIAVGDRTGRAAPSGRHRAPPEDDGLQPARRSAVAGCARRARVALVDQDGSSIWANPGGTPRAEGVFPPVRCSPWTLSFWRLPWSWWSW
jgi:hypothetical protein